jgi:hypothetical protein
MGYVTSLFARKSVAAAGDGIDAAAVLAAVGIDHAAPWDPQQMIPAERYYALLESIAARIDATDLPVRTGASMRLDEYGALGLAFKAATTLGDSYARVVRYARLWTGVAITRCAPRPGGRCSSCTATASGGWACGCRTRRRWPAPWRWRGRSAPTRWRPGRC